MPIYAPGIDSINLVERISRSPEKSKRKLLAVRKLWPQGRFALEPGRGLVQTAGEVVLKTKRTAHTQQTGAGIRSPLD